MFIAMNRFKILPGAEAAFEEVWTSRDTHLPGVPGFVSFHLLRGPVREDHVLYSSHTIWHDKAAFEACSPDAGECFSRAETEGKWFADLSALARQRLRAAGIGSLHGNDGTPAWCTVTRHSRFFSHRRDAGRTGRQGGLVWRDREADRTCPA